MLLLGLALLTAAALFYTYPLAAMIERFGGSTPLNRPLSARPVLPFLLLGLALVLVYLAYLRYQFLRRRELYTEAGCPSCGKQSLMRTARTLPTRWARFAGVSTSIYECRDCVWRGARLDRGTVPLARSSQGSWIIQSSPVIALVILAAALMILQLQRNSEAPSTYSLTPLPEWGSRAGQLGATGEGMKGENQSLIHGFSLQPFLQGLITAASPAEPGVREVLVEGAAKGLERVQKLVDDDFSLRDARDWFAQQLMPGMAADEKGRQAPPPTGKEPAAVRTEEPFSPVTYGAD